ncbi:ADP-ribose pyrophosphatase, mitochondrial-like [Artemia franciscana]|uniref:ADP-ribose pyrophosphatase, mitochondrial-like n=1 Tax=Artemia franciscana TaxID=6661 RepID=UPI0032DAA3BA
MFFCVYIWLMFKKMLKMNHEKCVNQLYPRSKVQRFHLEPDQISWENPLKDYNPPDYTSESLFNKPWADKDSGDKSFAPRWNEKDGNVDRRSFIGYYQVVSGRPLNPIGRTGIQGRGVLGKWGPNHAADPVVTRWACTDGGDIKMDETTRKRILQFVAIQRGDTGEWALPGGMVDPGEVVSETLKREFMEEALNSLMLAESDKDDLKKKIELLFKHGDEVYRGYVDDPRNTDNSWMETVAVNFHDDNGDLTLLELKAGDDAINVRWVDINRDLKLYASHSSIIEKVVKLRDASW